MQYNNINTRILYKKLKYFKINLIILFLKYFYLI